MAKRRVAVAVPARDEEGWIGECLGRLLSLPADPRISSLKIVVLANNCTDRTVEIAEALSRANPGAMEVRSVRFPEGNANAGAARRASLDAAADRLVDAHDALLCTDADTLVATSWLTRTLDYFDAGYDAVAGMAHLEPAEMRTLPRPHRVRLSQIRRYHRALDDLRHLIQADEPWPRHYYEGGASIALTLGMYRRIGGAPTPEVGEDKALFDAVRSHGGRIRHARDVRVATSCRLAGRTSGGASGTLAIWGRQGDGEPIHEVATIDGMLGLSGSSSAPLTFAALGGEVARARALVANLRVQERSESGSDAAPEVEPELGMAIASLGKELGP